MSFYTQNKGKVGAARLAHQKVPSSSQALQHTVAFIIVPTQAGGS